MGISDWTEDQTWQYLKESYIKSVQEGQRGRRRNKCLTRSSSRNQRKHNSRVKSYSLTVTICHKTLVVDDTFSLIVYQTTNYNQFYHPYYMILEGISYKKNPEL